ncbi:DUF3489 domain-containing protein, partial [Sphingomonas sp. CFBP 13720]|uniref:DUF3489 domain-containing protein n=1 Tax=Sphingomonas sp. CFBP 13720 TaxID=2775302 RepID=UPI00177B5562
MPRLNDTQSILLAHAAQNDTASLYPLPLAFSDGADRVRRAIATLLRHGLVEERETVDAKAVHRTDHDLRYGMFATAAGLAAIGIGEVGEGSAVAAPEPAVAAVPTPATATPRPTKAGAVLALLSQPAGATLGELISLTGWLPHTTRAAL